MTQQKFYVTTAIAYPNGAPHVGHAYEYIATDAIARFKRLDGFDVRFLTGTDVHGLKMAQTAEAEGIPTADLARRNSDVFQRLQEVRPVVPSFLEASSVVSAVVVEVRLVHPVERLRYPQAGPLLSATAATGAI